MWWCRLSSVFENIIGIILVVFALIFVSVIVIVSGSRDALQQTQQRQLIIGQEQSRTGFTTILRSTEGTSQLSVEELLGISIATVKPVVVTGNASVNLTKELQTRLDTLFGPNNTYLLVTPVPRGVNLQFVIDTSSSVSAERNTIATNLEMIQQELLTRITRTGREQVHTQIYLLPSSDQTLCQQFDDLALPFTSCTILSEYMMYNDLNWTRPSFGMKDYYTWEAMNHRAVDRDFAESDWAAGTAYAALEYDNNPYLKKATSINLIFPLSDELSTSSKRDLCFNQATLVDFAICSLCDEQCPVIRSELSVNQSVAALRATGSIASPIYSVNCDFAQNPGYNSFPSTSYSSQFRSTSGDWCGQNSCTACTTGTVPGSYCFHSACSTALRTQMQDLATRTGGRLFNINSPSEIPSQVVGMFDSLVQQYNVTVGVKNLSRDRFVYNEIISLPNGELGRVTLWVYR